MADQILDVLLSSLLGSQRESIISSQHRHELVRGDVICVRDGFSNRYGVWTGKNVIMYGNSLQGIKYVHERSLKNFLRGATSYSICLFPKKYGHPRRMPSISPIQDVVMPQNKIRRMLEQAEKARRYRCYSPEETAVRAEKAIGRSDFASSEHFAVWCKTGMAESYDWEALREAWESVITY